MNEYRINNVSFVGRLLQALMAVAIFIVFLCFAGGIATHAEESGKSVVVTGINYDNSTITLRLDSEDTRLFLSNSAQKKWEYVPVTLVSEGGYKTATLDISWVSLNSDYVMSFKGDVSTTPMKVTIPKRATNLKVKYDMSTESVSFTNATADDIEWKKKEALNWTSYNAATFSEALATFLDNGASLMFRKKAVNGTSASSTGSRAGKEVTVNIPKKTSAPSITISDERMVIPVKKGLSYRYVDADGNATSDWTVIDADGENPVSVLAPAAMYNTETSTAGSDVYIQFCQKASSSSQVSKCRTVKIPAQQTMTENDKNTSTYSYIEYTSSTEFQMVFKTAGESNILEYCIITADMQKLGVSIENINDKQLTWNEVNSSTPIKKAKDSSNKLEDGTQIYFRRKAVKSLGDENYKMASPVCLLGTLSYPRGAVTESFTLLQTVDGMVKDGNNTLSFSFYSDTKGEIKTVQFRADAGATACGTAKFKSTVKENDGQDPSKKYTYTVTLTDLSGISKKGTMLYAYIYFGNESASDPTQASIKSDSSAGIGLYIYPRSTSDNPDGNDEKKQTATKLTAAGYNSWANYSALEDKIGFTSKINRVYMSNRADDQSDFRIRLRLGTLYVPNLNAESSESYSNDKLAVTKIKYDGVELDSSDYFTAEYYEETDSDTGKNYRMAVLTIHADEIEKLSQIDDRDVDTPFYIYLNNGEILTGALTMNLQRTATVRSDAITFTEGRLSAWIESTTTDATGAVTVTRARDIDQYYTILLDIASSLGGKTNYAVGVKTVTWNGTNILYGAKNVSSGIEITLDNDLLNGITGLATAVTHDIRIELTNGYVITNELPMTINPSGNN